MTVDPAELYTKSGLSELLSKRYPGASLPGQDPFHSATPNYAAMTFRDENRLRQMKHFGDLADALEAIGDRAGAKALRNEIDDTFIRNSDPLEDAMDRSVNGGRR